jgi:hypothetical protein
MSLTAAIQAARSLSPWRVGNAVLYDLCGSRPGHTDEADVIAKIWLIGRSYAAAIERRRNKIDENDNFYVNTVAPLVVNSPIDRWIHEAKQYDCPSAEAWSTLLKVHFETTRLFKEISGLEKRSLASKYLHFHVPQLFYIYDTRAVEALDSLSHKKILPCTSRSRSQPNVDNDYRKLAEKCRDLQQHVQDKYGISLNPREIDSLLLYVSEQKFNLGFQNDGNQLEG